MSDLDNKETANANEEEEEPQRTRDVSESSKSGNANEDLQQSGLLDTKILDVGSGLLETNEDVQQSGLLDAGLNNSTPRLSQPRVTRFLYFYFMLGYFICLFICIIWGFIGISYIFVGFPGIGVAYFGGLFVPSLWAVILLIFDLIIWKKNRDHPRRPLVINLQFCCGRINYKNGKDLTQGWYFVIFLYVWFGILLATPSGSWALPIAAITLSIITMTVIVDWEYYYIQNDFNGLYGTHMNPWRYLVLTSLIQFVICVIVLLGHFLAHWRCIYEPEYYDEYTHYNICHDWVPYEIMAVVYGFLLFMYFYKRFQGDALNSNVLDKRMRYYLWFQSALLLIAIVWMIIEIFDGHVYIYDVIGFIYLWFVMPVFVTTLRAFKIR